MNTEQSTARAARLEAEPLLPIGPAPGLFRGTASSIRHLLTYRELLDLLVRRELKARFKDSVLGFLWSLLRPLALLIVYYVAIGKFLGAERSIPSFAIYIFSGLTIWALFSEVVSGSTGSILANSGLIKKVYLPREVFPLSVVGSALFNFATQLLILVAVVVVTGQAPTGSRLLYLPLSVAVILVFATAIGLVLAAVNVYLRDVQYLVEIALMVFFWASPVVYSWELVRGAIDSPALEQLYLLNPVTAAVLGMQRAFWVAGTEEPFPDNLGTHLTVMLLVGTVLLWASQRVFARLEGNFAQEL
jgi:ABC-2 type transport system permease protein